MVRALGIICVVAAVTGVAAFAGFWAGKTSERLDGKPTNVSTPPSADPAELERQLAGFERAIEYNKQRLVLLEATAQHRQADDLPVSTSSRRSPAPGETPPVSPE